MPHALLHHQTVDDQRRPAGLVGGAAAPAAVAVKELVEEHQVPPERVLRVSPRVACREWGGGVFMMLYCRSIIIQTCFAT